MATHAARAWSSAVTVPSTSTTPSPSGTLAVVSFRTKRPTRRSTTAAAADTHSPNADNATCDTVVLDGANLAWTFSASLYAKLKCRTRLPLSRGLTLALEADVWRDMGVSPIAFMPQSYVEGPLHGLADGGSLDTLVPGKVVYLGSGVWRNTVLWQLTEKGLLVAVQRPKGQRDADDKRIIQFARERNAMICSNDRYEDHIAGAKAVPGTCETGSKDLRRWLKSNRSGYEFCVGIPEEAAYKAGKPGVERPPVGSDELPSPPNEEIGNTPQEENEWRADVHATGSSRPWAIGVDRWGRDKGGKGRKRRRGAARSFNKPPAPDDPEFPYWALSDEDLPVNFKLKKK